METHHRGTPRCLLRSGVLAGSLLAAAFRGIFLFFRGGGGIERDLDRGAESSDDDAERREAEREGSVGDSDWNDGSDSKLR